ncbi:MAG: arylamine N-acetyltransferase [Gammaproteobacteria bacterium]|nr:arylamine N-acetyltransferase [Gammaproteobacteria bacterium]
MPLKGLNPDLSTLKALHRAHAFNIPFSSLDVIAWDYEPRLFVNDDEHLSYSNDKVITQALGGSCYDTNILFMRALKEIGFEVHLMQGRVVLMNPEAAKSHVILKVVIDNTPYLVDVSLGIAGLIEPIKLEVNDDIQQDYMKYQLEKNNGIYSFNAMMQGQWKTCYTFLESEDVKMMDVHFISYARTEQERSKEKGTIMASIFTSDGLVVLLGDSLTKDLMVFSRTASEDKVLKLNINTDAKFKNVCDEYFGIKVPNSKQTIFDGIESSNDSQPLLAQVV